MPLARIGMEESRVASDRRRPWRSPRSAPPPRGLAQQPRRFTNDPGIVGPRRHRHHRPGSALLGPGALGCASLRHRPAAASEPTPRHLTADGWGSASLPRQSRRASSAEPRRHRRPGAGPDNRAGAGRRPFRPEIPDNPRTAALARRRLPEPGDRHSKGSAATGAAR